MSATNSWREEPPDEEGFWWLYGDEEFGTMGGNYSGTFLPDIELRMVDVRRLGSGLVGVASGRMIQLRPFNEAARLPGYVGGVAESRAS